MYLYEWIIADDEVMMYKVHTYQAYRADECGTKWMTSEPADTVYYKSETLERAAKHLPEGFEFDPDTETFSKCGVEYKLVNETDGSVSLVSAEGIIKWF